MEIILCLWDANTDKLFERDKIPKVYAREG